MALQLPFITYITLTNQNNSTMKQTASEGKQERNLHHLKTTYLVPLKERDPLNKHGKVSNFIHKGNIFTAHINGKHESSTILIHPPTEKGKKRRVRTNHLGVNS